MQESRPVPVLLTVIASFNGLMAPRQIKHHKKPRPINPDLGGSAAVMMGWRGAHCRIRTAAARLSFAETDSEGMNMVNRGRFVLNWGEM